MAATLTAVHHGRVNGSGWILDHACIPARPEVGTVVTVISRYRQAVMPTCEWRVIPSPWHVRILSAPGERPIREVEKDPNPHGSARYEDSFRLQAFDVTTGEAQNAYLDVRTHVDTTLVGVTS